MKKRFALLLLLLLPIISIGQDQVGIKGGYSYYWFTQPSDRYQYHYNFSNDAYSVVVSLEQRSVHAFNLAYKLKYTYRSFAIKSDESGLGSGGRVDYHYTLGNLYLQVLPQFVFGSKLRFFVYPGLYFGTLLHSSLTGTKYTWIMGQTGKTVTHSGNARGYYPVFEFGVLVGLGIEVPIHKNLILSLENNLNMNILPIADAWGSTSIKMINLNFEVGVAYVLQKTKAKSKSKGN